MLLVTRSACRSRNQSTATVRISPTPGRTPRSSALPDTPLGRRHISTDSQEAGAVGPRYLLLAHQQLIGVCLDWTFPVRLCRQGAAEGGVRQRLLIAILFNWPSALGTQTQMYGFCLEPFREGTLVIRLVIPTEGLRVGNPSGLGGEEIHSAWRGWRGGRRWILGQQCPRLSYEIICQPVESINPGSLSAH